MAFKFATQPSQRVPPGGGIGQGVTAPRELQNVNCIWGYQIRSISQKKGLRSGHVRQKTVRYPNVGHSIPKASDAALISLRNAVTLTFIQIPRKRSRQGSLGDCGNSEQIYLVLQIGAVLFQCSRLYSTSLTPLRLRMAGRKNCIGISHRWRSSSDRVEEVVCASDVSDPNVSDFAESLHPAICREVLV